MSHRVQLALNVNDIEEAIAFYTKLFGTEPAKIRPGYANFAVAEPPLKLVLLENPGQGGTLNHLGIEVPNTDAVDAEQTRLAETGLASIDKRDTTCCYARQDKFWVEGAPDGESWEIYTVLADSQTFYDHDHGGAACCSDGSSQSDPSQSDASQSDPSQSDASQSDTSQSDASQSDVSQSEAGQSGELASSAAACC